MKRSSPVIVIALAVLIAALFFVPRFSALTQTRNSRAILSEPPPPVDHRIAYGTGPLQFGDLRLPPLTRSKPPYPLVVVLHGGCWLAEYGLSYMGHLSADLTAADIITWNLEYRR